MSIQSINPVNGEIIQIYTANSENEVNSKIKQAQEAWRSWRQVPLH